MTNITKIRKNKIKVFTLIILSICIALCLTLADLFSSLITVGGFSFSYNTTKSTSFNIYAISLYSSQTLISANDMATICKRKNGAGYIFQTENSYEVLASGYENESDATKVKTNLNENDVECNILCINYPEITISVTVNSEEKNALDNALSCFKNIYKKLYDLSVSIDTNLLTEIQAKINLGEIISYFSKIQSTYETHFNPKITTSLLELKLSLMNVDTLLTEAKEFSDINIPYSSQIKLTYFEILNEQLELISKL